MSKGHITGEIEFIVAEKSENNRINYNGKLHYVDCRWFEKVKGEKKGLQFIIPVEHPEYSREMEKKLASLSEYDKIRLKLKSINERDTAWICEEFVDSP